MGQGKERRESKGNAIRPSKGKAESPLYELLNLEYEAQMERIMREVKKESGKERRSKRRELA